MNMQNIKISVRLNGLSLFILTTLLFVGFGWWYTLNNSNKDHALAMTQAKSFEQSIDLARTAQVNFKIQVQEWKNILLRGQEQESFNKYKDEFAKKDKETQLDLENLKKIFIHLHLDYAQIDEAIKMHNDLNIQYMTALKHYEVNNAASPFIVDKLVKGMDRKPTKQIDDIVVYVVKEADLYAQNAQIESNNNFKNTLYILSTLLGLSFIVSLITTKWIIVSIIKPLNNAVNLANTVASGNLTTHIDIKGNDEINQLLSALNTMNSNLTKIVKDVHISSDTIFVAANEIAQGNMDLSSRTEEQASSLEETASAMEQLTTTVQQNSEHAITANKLALSASKIAIKGGQDVNEVVITMDGINDSSKKIVEIISVIDSIAFQTNILALNAAVEAARAGEQGRGFAVVASEVRTLAHRSAQAAKEIKILINDSVSQVNNGSQLVKKAGITMHEIVDSVSSVTTIISQIATASKEQTLGIEQINQAISQMDNVTQQNAALVEEAAAAAESMKEQTANLITTIGVFKI